MSENDLFDDSNLVETPVPDALEPIISDKPEMSDGDRIRRLVKAAQDRISAGRPTAGDWDVIAEYGGKAALADQRDRLRSIMGKK